MRCKHDRRVGDCAVCGYYNYELNPDAKTEGVTLADMIEAEKVYNAPKATFQLPPWEDKPEAPTDYEPSPEEMERIAEHPPAEAREFWIGTVGKDNVLPQNRNHYASDREQMDYLAGYGEESKQEYYAKHIHVIEFSAYEQACTERDLLREMFNEWRAVVGGDMLADGFKKAIGVGPTMLREMRERHERYREALERIAAGPIADQINIAVMIASEALK